MRPKLTLKKIIEFEDLSKILKKIEFRGLYNKDGSKVRPYKKVSFLKAIVYPSLKLGQSPTIKIKNKMEILFSPQPTIYLNQIEIIKTVDSFLRENKMKVNKMNHAIEYDWEGRDTFNMIPPIIEHHIYDLKEGFINLDSFTNSFKNLFIKDSISNLHNISERYLKNFFIDEVSSIKHLDVFHSNASIINYGLQSNGKQDFYIVCDGMHRIDYSLEYLHEPINVILVEPEKRPLIPYYAFPTPFYPTIRLSSKQSEKMYPKLERDKIHLFNDFIKKVLHYDWSPAGLNISKLRSNVEIY